MYDDDRAVNSSLPQANGATLDIPPGTNKPKIWREIYTHTHTLTHLHKYIHVYTTYTHTHTRTHARTHTHTHTLAHTHTHTHTHTPSEDGVVTEHTARVAAYFHHMRTQRHQHLAPCVRVRVCVCVCVCVCVVLYTHMHLVRGLLKEYQ